MAVDTSLPETIEQRKAHQYSTLHHIGVMAHELACDAHARAKEQLAAQRAHTPSRPPANNQINYATTFATLSRAVRQGIVLEIRLDAPLRTRPAYVGALPPPDPR